VKEKSDRLSAESALNFNHEELEPSDNSTLDSTSGFDSEEEANLKKAKSSKSRLKALFSRRKAAD